MPPKKKSGERRRKKASISKKNKQSRIRKYELGANSHAGSVLHGCGYGEVHFLTINYISFPCSPKDEFDDVCCSKDDSSADEYGMSSLTCCIPLHRLTWGYARLHTDGGGSQ